MTREERKEETAWRRFIKAMQDKGALITEWVEDRQLITVTIECNETNKSTKVKSL